MHPGRVYGPRDKAHPEIYGRRSAAVRKLRPCCGGRRSRVRHRRSRWTSRLTAKRSIEARRDIRRCRKRAVQDAEKAVQLNRSLGFVPYDAPGIAHRNSTSSLPDRTGITPVRLGEGRPQPVFALRGDDQVDKARQQAAGPDFGAGPAGCVADRTPISW